MISLHQLFRVLSRVSVDPAAPFYASSVRSPVAGGSGGPQGPPSPIKIRGPLNDPGMLMTTCSSTCTMQRTLTPDAPTVHADEALCEGDSSSFPLSSNSSAAGDIEGPSAAASLAGSTGAPAKSLLGYTRDSLRTPCSSSRSPSTSATSPLQAPTSITNSPCLSACSTLLAAPPSGAAAAAQESLLGALEQAETQRGGAFAPSRDTCSAAPYKALQQQRLVAAAAAAETPQETEIYANSGGPYRGRLRQRRRPCRQQTPWGSSSSRAAAAALLQLRNSDSRGTATAASQHRREGRVVTRGRAASATAATAGSARNGGETEALSGSLSRRRSVASTARRQQQQLASAAAAAASCTLPEDSVSLSLGLDGDRQCCLSGPTVSWDTNSDGDTSRPLGVCFSPPKDVWRARITVEGRQFEQQFSVKRHGFDGARILATRWRAEMENARTSRPLLLP